MEDINYLRDIFQTPGKMSGVPYDDRIERAKKGWDKRGEDTLKRLAEAKNFVKSGTKIVDPADAVALLEAVIKPGDRVAIEGDNQKQANFLAKAFAKVNPSKINNIHMIQSVLALPEHLDVFEKGIASKVDFCYSGPVAARLANMVMNGKITIGAIHTYMELFARTYLDLTPRVCLVAANAADKEGNLYTGFNTEETHSVIEATKFRKGIVIVQVNEIVNKVPRVDVPGGWVDFIIPTEEPYYIEPLFTRDPRLITESQIFIAMMALVSVYANMKLKL